LGKGEKKPRVKEYPEGEYCPKKPNPKRDWGKKGGYKAQKEIPGDDPNTNYGLTSEITRL